MSKEIDLKEFAERVERVCEFFLSQTEADGSEDRRIIEDLKEVAANIQFDQAVLKFDLLKGLSDHMSGLPSKEQ